MDESPHHFKSGFAAIVGRPNVGKSTLMNAILGVDVSIATSKPQTTRNRILGIHTIAGVGQIVFVDTPGIHEGRSRLHHRMSTAALSTAHETDVVLWVVEAPSLGRGDRPVLWGDDARVLAALPPEIPTILVVNKIDKLHRRDELLPLLATLGGLERFAEIVPISALKKANLEPMVRATVAHLPAGPAHFPEDMVTDRAERFIAGELIRQQLLEQTAKEVPYGVAVEIEDFIDGADGVIHIHAVVHVERDSHKGIVIGKGGTRLRDIGIAARGALEAFFERRVELRTFVRVAAGWVDNDDGLERFGYDEESL